MPLLSLPFPVYHTSACVGVVFTFLFSEVGGKGKTECMLFCVSGWKSVDSIPKLVTDYMSKKIKVDEFVTHTLPFNKINEAFELMHTGKR